MLAHVRANQTLFLGAVFRIVREWWERGRSVLADHRHDFRRWAEVLGWITEPLLGLAPLLDEHEGVQNRIASPALSWLRLLCLAVDDEGKLGLSMQATELAAICFEHDCEAPGMKEGGYGDCDEDDRVDAAPLAIGRQLKKCFTFGAVATTGQYAVTRTEETNVHGDTIRKYVFLRASGNAPVN